MIIARYLAKALISFLYLLCGFKSSPIALYYYDARFLEKIVHLFNERRDGVILVKQGLYMFNGDEAAIYSHTEGFSMKADVVSVRWKKIVDVTDEEWEAMGTNTDDWPQVFLGNMFGYGVDVNSYLTLFECNRLRGRLFNDVEGTLTLRQDLYQFSPE